MGQTACMSEWGRSLYGDPCRECGYRWSLSEDQAIGLVAATPARYAEVLNGRNGSEQHPDLEWSAGGYVCHVADNLRIWAERLAGASLGASGTIVPYDDELLARARRYQDAALAAALWSLRRAVGDWQEALRLASQKGVVLHHPERGEQTVLDVLCNNAHESHHHAFDIERSIGAP